MYISKYPAYMPDDKYCLRPVVNLITGEINPLGFGAKEGSPYMFCGYQRGDTGPCTSIGIYWKGR